MYMFNAAWPWAAFFIDRPWRKWGWIIRLMLPRFRGRVPPSCTRNKGPRERRLEILWLYTLAMNMANNISQKINGKYIIMMNFEENFKMIRNFFFYLTFWFLLIFILNFISFIDKGNNKWIINNHDGFWRTF